LTGDSLQPTSEDSTRVDVSAREPVAIGPTERQTEQAAEGAPSTSDQAPKLAIKLAVDAGEYDRAAALLEVATRTAKPAAAVVSILDRTKG
jgi:hypothetical protein